ncbi:MAG: hypothetical protein KDA24_13695 [Deltaproteobacteria bacterium]|nr:hypothetical protein [Deltaproteobacteria bacterium]
MGPWLPMVHSSSPIARSVLAVAACLMLTAGSCESLEEAAKAAVAAKDYAGASDLYLEAAKTVACPDRGRLLLRRAETLELDGQVRSAARSIDKSVELCPDYPDARWARAQRAMKAGDRDLAFSDAKLLKDSVPAAAELFSDLSMELEVERGVRARAAQLVTQLSGLLNLEAPSEELPNEEPAVFARQVPVPMTLRYQAQQSVRGDASFELKWEEVQSYRGDPADESHVLVRTLELPPLARELPLPTRLTMSNQRMGMRFAIDGRGKILEAGWLSRGPDRGMRPEMLRPEIEGMLKRRRIFDPGESGRRAVGDTWRGEDVRLVDGKARTVEYESKAEGFESIRGIPTLRIKSKLSGRGISTDETVWLHVETAVPVRIVRDSKYSVSFDFTEQSWRDHSEWILSAVSGGE